MHLKKGSRYGDTGSGTQPHHRPRRGHAVELPEPVLRWHCHGAHQHRLRLTSKWTGSGAEHEVLGFALVHHLGDLHDGECRCDWRLPVHAMATLASEARRRAMGPRAGAFRWRGPRGRVHHHDLRKRVPLGILLLTSSVAKRHKLRHLSFERQCIDRSEEFRI